MLRRRYVFALLVVLTAIVLWRTAWISDDAQITVRVVLNTLHGYGPNFNIDERVQSYTHPAWFLLVTVLTWASHLDVMLVLLGMSAIAVVVALLVLCRWVAVSAWHALVAGLLLLLSKAFVDYSTSGLENPLTHVLVVVLIALSLAHARSAGPQDGSLRHLRMPWAVSLLTGLVWLNRQDLGLLVAPLCILVLWSLPNWRSRLLTLVPGATVVVGWSAFAVIYYGSPFPNTAFAKLSFHATRGEWMERGLGYLVDSLMRDPVTLTVIVVACVLTAMKRERIDLAIMLGVLLYLAYIVWIGGDFMSGRFLTGPLVASMCVLARAQPPRLVGIVGALVLVGMGAVNLPVTFLSPSDYEDLHKHGGVADERGYYFTKSGVAAVGLRALYPPTWLWTEGATVQSVGFNDALGGAGLAVGPSQVLVDSIALADPLLARLAWDPPRGWRIGHVYRPIPDGYFESRLSGRNEVVDPDIHAFYDKVRVITRGPLFTKERWRLIVDQLIGGLEAPSDIGVMQPHP